jgi:dimethylamine--corrinoid protein Co-methyltransferase
LDKRITTRLGDGGRVEMTPSEIRADIEAGVAIGVKRAKVEPLTQDEVDRLVEIFTAPGRFASVEPGEEVVMSSDGTCDLPRPAAAEQLLVFQDAFGSDTLELGSTDYSYKAVKTIASEVAQAMKMAQLELVAPAQYGAMPDLGRYSQPDGPFPNWSELLPQGRVAEARAAQEQAVEASVEDIVHVTDELWAAGTDGMDFDTAAAAGDGDFLATLRATAIVRRKYPHIGIQLGMASEMVLGMHGELEYRGRRLAGMWPVDQLRVAQEAGATVFGPAVNVNTTKSVAWNVARTITIVKPCMAEALIPVHPNVGMGVCGVPMTAFPPHDALGRVSRALVQVLGADGL